MGERPRGGGVLEVAGGGRPGVVTRRKEERELEPGGRRRQEVEVEGGRDGPGVAPGDRSHPAELVAHSELQRGAEAEGVVGPEQHNAEAEGRQEGQGRPRAPGGIFPQGRPGEERKERDGHQQVRPASHREAQEQAPQGQPPGPPGAPVARAREEPGAARQEEVAARDRHFVDIGGAQDERGHVGQAQGEVGQPLHPPGPLREVGAQQPAEQEGGEEEAAPGQEGRGQVLGEVAQPQEPPGDEEQGPGHDAEIEVVPPPVEGGVVQVRGLPPALVGLRHLEQRGIRLDREVELPSQEGLRQQVVVAVRSPSHLEGPAPRGRPGVEPGQGQGGREQGSLAAWEGERPQRFAGRSKAGTSPSR